MKEINSFINSIQKIKDVKNFYNHECEKYKNKSKTFKIINAVIQYVHTCVTLSITGVGLVVVPIASGIGAGLCLFSRNAGEYLKRKEQHNIKKYTLACETVNRFQKLHAKCLEDNIIDQNEYNKLKQTFDVDKNKKTKLISEFIFLG